MDVADSSEPETATHPAAVSAQSVMRATSVVCGRVSAAIAAEGVTTEQWQVLDHLDRHGGCTMSSLAGATGLNSSTLTRIVDRLTTSALAYRNADRDDRRRVLVHLSARGSQLTRQLRPQVTAAEATAAADLSPAERTDLAGLLGRLR